MKLLVFAHTPPPHHGQSYMVQLMLNGFGGDQRGRKNGAPNHFGIECYHINARFSRGIEDIGKFQGIKLARLLLHCLEAIWCRFRYGVESFYYIPAPGKRVALYRDWLVMLICRPFFKKVILHWHAAGLAEWLETSASGRTRAITGRLLKSADLSIVLSKYNFADAEKLSSRRICIATNGIPDPCPDFAKTILPRRKSRFVTLQKLLKGESAGEGADGDPRVVNILFLAHCSREKGLFAAIEGVASANRSLAARNLPVRLKLLVAGAFVAVDERAEFDCLLQTPELAGTVVYLGFVSGWEKERALREADLLCFPTRYLGENQPVNLIEAMAFGLPILTTRWRSVPEMLPAGYPGIVATQSPSEIADVLLALMMRESGEGLREHFLREFAIERHLSKLAQALHSVETTL